jgi:hypothetical protein
MLTTLLALVPAPVNLSWANWAAWVVWTVTGNDPVLGTRAE